MESKQGTDLEAFGAELRAWLADHLTPEVVEAGGHQIEGGSLEVLRAWNRTLADGGWAAPSWPVEHGGRGAGVARAAGLPGGDEPGAGSGPGQRDRRVQHRAGDHAVRHRRAEGALPPADAAGRRDLVAGHVGARRRLRPGLAAHRRGRGRRRLRRSTGRRPGTRSGHFADWCQLYVRTDPTAKKHAGITCFLVDLRTPGIEARPLTTITGGQAFAELFFTDARVPRSAMLGAAARRLVGGHDDAELRAGRGGPPAPLAGQPAGRPAWPTPGPAPAWRTRCCGSAWPVSSPGIRCMRYLTERSLGGPGRGGCGRQPGQAVLGRTATRNWRRWRWTWSGLDALDGEDRWGENLLAVRQASIAGGTTEINKNIVGEHVLGLPR